jgi:hypothetical protein
VAQFSVVEHEPAGRTTMKMDLKYESYIDLSPQHIAALRNLINTLMKRVGEHGEFRIELDGVLHYGTYMVIKPGEIVEVRVTPLKRIRARRSHRLQAQAKARLTPSIMGSKGSRPS